MLLRHARCLGSGVAERHAPLVGAVCDAEAVAGAPGLGVGEVVDELHLLHQIACIWHRAQYHI